MYIIFRDPVSVPNINYRGIKSFQEEFFDDTNDEIVAIFDLLWSEDHGPQTSEQVTRNQSEIPKTNVRRVNNANHHRGLSLLLNVNADDYFITTDDFIAGG